MSVDGQAWNPITGYVVATGTIKRIVYQETVKCRPMGDDRYSFEYSLGTASLPPTFLFTESKNQEPLGVRWFLSGLVGREVSGQIIATSTATMEVVVGYKYTDSILSTMCLDKPVTGKWRFNLLNIIAFNNLPTMSVELKNPVQLLPQLRFEICITIRNAFMSTSVEKTRINLHQDITYSLPNCRKLKFQNQYQVLCEIMPPKYSTRAGNQFSYVFDLILNDLPMENSCMAICNPFHSDSDTFLFNLLAPSTIYAVQVYGQASITVKYNLEVIATICSFRCFADLTASIPIIISSPLEKPAQLGAPLTREAFLPILNSALEDFSRSIPVIRPIVHEWQTLRRNAIERDRMVTTSADHALELIVIFEKVASQMTIFLDLTETRSRTIPWPKDAIPFNKFILEMELLVRALPFRVLDQDLSDADEKYINLLLQRVDDFLEKAIEIITAWLKDRPFEHKAQFRQTCASIMACLECIAMGNITNA